jgi:hypothetical protein
MASISALRRYRIVILKLHRLGRNPIAALAFHFFAVAFILHRQEYNLTNHPGVVIRLDWDLPGYSAFYT